MRCDAALSDPTLNRAPRDADNLGHLRDAEVASWLALGIKDERAYWEGFSKYYTSEPQGGDETPPRSHLAAPQSLL